MFFLFLSRALRRKMPRLPLRCEEMIALELTEGGEDSLFTNAELTVGARWTPCALRRLWPYHSKEPSLYV